MWGGLQNWVLTRADNGVTGWTINEDNTTTTPGVFKRHKKTPRAVYLHGVFLFCEAARNKCVIKLNQGDEAKSKKYY